MPDRAIRISIDQYGNGARVSALADFWEVAALAGKSFSPSELADTVVDRGWTALETELLIATGETQTTQFAGEQETGEALADSVVDALNQRSIELGARYPFEFDDERRLKPTDFEAARSSAYVSLLATSVLHAWPVDPGFDVELAFERVVVHSLTAAGYRAHGMGTGTLGANNFNDRLNAAAAGIGAKADPSASYRSQFAQDERVDVVASRRWPDSRLGQWTMIGQATCGQSETWLGKLKAPSIEQWKHFFLEFVPPQAFLAVPHHVYGNRFEYLLETGDGRTVLDRLRLAAPLDEPDEEMRRLTDALFEFEVEAAF